MGNLFLSHASADGAVARLLAARLREHGYTSLFLDFDPADGIPAGRNWERELYRRLKACRAVIALCSEASIASRWCFAEITQARSLGKVLLPVKVGNCQVDSILADRQVVDFTADEEEGFTRLLRGLEEAGLADDAPWNPLRSPYPGLSSFSNLDAAVFYGREEEVDRMLDTLGRLRRQGEPRLVLILGASGSGKSSLMRAGVLPRLARDRERWLVVPPFRPGDRPLAELAQALATSFNEYDRERSWRGIHELVERDGAEALCDLALDLLEAARMREGTVLLAVDQLEELLAPDASAAAEPFLGLLAAVLGGRSGPLFVLATLRSDFLGAFQQRPEVVDLAFADEPLGPLPMSRLARVIEGPAERGGIELEPGLVQLMVADTETGDALPLLAFTLRRMWERSKDRFTVEIYKEMDTVQGAIAKVADEILADRAISKAEETELRNAFLGLVRLDDEGRYARRRAFWNDLPAASRPLLKRFVEARLLVSGTEDGTVEVAHEALFRNWKRLAGWLAEEREFLLWCRRVAEAAAEWKHTGRDPGALLRAGRLAEAERWLRERGESALRSGESELMEASRVQHRRLERRRRWITGGSIAAAALFLGLAIVAFFQSRRAENQSRLAVARHLAPQAVGVLDGTGEGLELSLLLATESLRSSWTYDGYGAWVQAVDLLPRRPEPLAAAGGPAAAVTVHPQKPLLALGGEGGVRLIDLAAGRMRRRLETPGSVQVVAFSPDGRWVAGANLHRVSVWDVSSGDRKAEIEGLEAVTDLAFGGNFLAVADRSQRIRLLSTDTWTEEPSLEDEGRVLALIFPMNTRYRRLHLLTAGVGGMSVWDIQTRTRTRFSADRPIWSLAYAPTSDELAAAQETDLSIWSFISFGYSRLTEEDEKPLSRYPPTWGIQLHGDLIEALEFSRNGRWLASGSWDRTVRLWTGLGKEWMRLPVVERVASLAFTPDGSHLVLAGSEPALLELRDTWASSEIRLGSPVTSVAFSPDGSHIASGEKSGAVRVFEVASGRAASKPVALGEPVDGLAFSPDGRRLVAVGRGAVYVIDGSSMTLTARLQHEGHPDWVALSPDDPWIATYTPSVFNRYDGLKRASRTRIWDLATGKEIAWRSHEDEDLANAHRSVHWKPLPDSLDEDSLPLGKGGRLALLESVVEWPRLSSGDEAVTPDGRWRAKNDAGDVWLLEPETNRRIALLRLPVGAGALALAFSPDGRWLATASGEPPAARSVEASPSGAGALRLWRLGPVEELIDEACTRVSRDLTPEEWERFIGGAYRETCPGR